MRQKNKSIALCLVFVVMVIFYAFLIVPAYAANANVKIATKVYEFDKDSNYEISSSLPKQDSSPIGMLTLSGSLSNDGKKDTYPSYKVNNGNVAISFSFNKSVLNTSEEKWHIINDNSKSVDGLNLDNKIKNGVVILQTSRDGKVWVNDVIKTNALISGADFSKDINSYAVNNIQLQNGCYYRLIVAYKMERKIGEKTYIFGLTTNTKEKKKVAEVYTFYLYDPNYINDSNVTAKNKYYFDDDKNYIQVKKDSGYSTQNIIPKKKTDPHFGWKLGKFYMTGFTDQVKDDKEIPVFRKTKDDKITLWFDLEQDINCLNNNSNLFIDEDNGGYDAETNTIPTNFKKGTLIIRHKDFQNNNSEPVIYTNFLASNATTTADTKIVLFEEGDYSVALNYMITDSSGRNSHTYYKIYFNFKIRNGNNMAFLFDAKTGAELKNGSITTNGFRVDLANSGYLKVNVKGEAISINENEIIKTNTIDNTVSNEIKTFKSEGIYTISSINTDTNTITTKTIYVGNNKYLRALAKNEISVDELNDLIRQGKAIADDGTIYTPEPDTEQEQTTNDFILHV